MANIGGGVPQSFGRYKVLSPLGKGAMASVYLAEDPVLNRLVAVKVIHAHLADMGELTSRFVVEAKTAAGLRSPNIVEIFDFGTQGGLHYLVMEYIDGPNLQAVLKLLDGAPMPPEVAAAVIAQAAEGLSSAEKGKVVHRDIKPENLMFTADGVLKIADFGIAHIQETNLTRTGSILGSPSYMAPEQIEGRKPSPQTDMFSLGSVFYYALTGRRAFVGRNIPAIMRAITEEPHPAILEVWPEANPQLAELVDTLLNKEPEQRGQGARWLALKLRGWLNDRHILDPADKVKEFLAETNSFTPDKTMVEQAVDANPPIKTPEKRQGSKGTSGNSETEKKGFSTTILLGAIGTGALILIAVVVVFVWMLGGKNPSQENAKNNSSPASESSQKMEIASPPVPPAPAILQSILVDPTQMDMIPGDNRGVRVTLNPAAAEAQLIWASSDSSIVQAGASGILAIGPGMAELTLSDALGRGPPAKVKVTVKALAQTPTPPTAAPVKKIPEPKAVTPVAASKPSVSPTMSQTLVAPSAPASESAYLTVISSPPFAEVFLDSKLLGNTPLKKAKVSTGKHKLMLSHRRFKEFDTTVNLKSGEMTLRFRLFDGAVP